MQKTIMIDGKAVEFRSTAAIPRLYRIKFGRDVFVDTARVKKAIEAERKRQKEDGTDASMLPPEALYIFENLAYIMAKHASGTSVPDNVEEWFEGFSTFSIYEVFPQIMEMWEDNNAQIAIPAKK